jgi:hypothetical protein
MLENQNSKTEVALKQSERCLSPASRLRQLPTKLSKINAMFGSFVRPDEDHGDVPSITLFQNGVLVDVHFSQGSAKFAQQRRDGGLGFFAKVAAGTRIERDIARATGSEPDIFG